MADEKLTRAEQHALRYQQIIEKFTPGCTCGPYRAIALVIDTPITK